MSAADLIHSVKSLPDHERTLFYEMLIGDEELREDILDSIAIVARRDEPTTPLDSVLRELNIKL
jgi:hypothetical protein